MKVKLYIRVRHPDGTRQYLNPVFSANGKLKPFYAMVKGTPEHHPEGVYNLRYKKAGKLVWQITGTDPQQAVTAKLKLERTMAAKEVGLEIKEEGPEILGRSLAESITTYLKEVKNAKSHRTYEAYSVTLRQFAESCSKPIIEAIDRHDILTYTKTLSDKGNVRRTVHNRLEFLKIW